MIESLLISACIFGSADSCENSPVAYYKYSGIERYVSAKEQYYSQQSPLLMQSIAIFGAAAQGRATFYIGRGSSISVDATGNYIGFKESF